MKGVLKKINISWYVDYSESFGQFTRGSKVISIRLCGDSLDRYYEKGLVPNENEIVEFIILDDNTAKIIYPQSEIVSNVWDEVKEILVHTKYMLPVSKFDIGVAVVDIPKAIELLKSKYKLIKI